MARKGMDTGGADSAIVQSSSIGISWALHFTVSSDNLLRHLTITNVNFVANRARSSCGALSVDTTVGIVFTNLTATENCVAGGKGEGLRIGQAGAPASVAFVDVVLERSKVEGSGGAVAVSSGSKLSVTRTTFAHNRALANGGGIACSGGAALTLRDGVMLTQNYASANGGGLQLEGGATLLALGQVTVGQNVAARHGGGLHLGADIPLAAYAGCQSVVLSAITSTGDWPSAASDGSIALLALDGDGEVSATACCVDALGTATQILVAEILTSTTSGAYAMSLCLSPGSYVASFSSTFDGNDAYNTPTEASKPVLLDAVTDKGKVLFSQTRNPPPLLSTARPPRKEEPCC
jgi:predicted outer membrane repeat protein